MKYEFKVELRRTNSRQQKLGQKEINISREKKQLILAHQIVRYMDENNVSTLHEMSQVVNVSVARLSQIVSLMYQNGKN